MKMSPLQCRMYIVYAAAVCWLLFMLIFYGSAGNPTAVLICSLVVSPGLFLLAVFVEGRAPLLVLNPKNQSWAFEFGDPFCIAPALVITALAWRDIPRDESHFYEQWWWMLTSAAVGLLFGLTFYVVDGAKYRKADVTKALKSPSKICHDLVVYPILSGTLVYGGVPLLFERSWHTWWVLGLFVAWLLLAVCDGVRNPDPRWLHPRWDVANFRMMSNTPSLQ